VQVQNNVLKHRGGDPGRSAAAEAVALRWVPAACGDLRRIHEFLEPVSPAAAARAVRTGVARARRIPAQPRLGEALPEFADRDVRRVIVRPYEIRYEVSGSDIYILRIFHTRENR